MEKNQFSEIVIGDICTWTSYEGSPNVGPFTHYLCKIMFWFNFTRNVWDGGLGEGGGGVKGGGGRD